MNTVAHPVSSKFGDIATGTNSVEGGYSIYGLFANSLGKHPNPAFHGTNEEGHTDHDEPE